MESFELVTGPDGPVVPVADLREHLRFLSSDMDALISGQADVAVELIESDLRRQLLTATWKLHLPCFPRTIEIEKSPVQSVTSITYVDGSGTTQTLDPSRYQVNTTREPAIICPTWGQAWPVTRRMEQAVTVTFVAGYGDETDVPEGIKQAIKLQVEGMFNGTEEDLMPTVHRLLQRYKYQLL